MSNEINNTVPTATNDDPIEVVCRLRPSELAVVKQDTGVLTNGGAVAAYVRKRVGAETR